MRKFVLLGLVAAFAAASYGTNIYSRGLGPGDNASSGDGTWTLGGISSYGGFAGALEWNYGTTDTSPAPGFETVCCDIFNEFSTGSTFPVNVYPGTGATSFNSVLPPNNPANTDLVAAADRFAYWHDTAEADGAAGMAALQLAVWKTEYQAAGLTVATTGTIHSFFDVFMSGTDLNGYKQVTYLQNIDQTGGQAQFIYTPSKDYHGAPEPFTMTLCAAGLGLAVIRRRRAAK